MLHFSCSVTNTQVTYFQGSYEWVKKRQTAVDLGKQLVIPREVLSSALKPDSLWSDSQWIVFFVWLTVPWEDAVNGTHERRKLKCAV